MRSARCRGAWIAVLLLLAGCLPVQQWYRPGTAEVQRNLDRADCLDQADRQAYQSVGLSFGVGFGSFLGPGCDRACAQQYRDHERSRRRLAQDRLAAELADVCMRVRGYSLRQGSPAE